jgi:hypothetical protein
MAHSNLTEFLAPVEFFLPQFSFAAIVAHILVVLLELVFAVSTI